jgi:hypothetical protein
MIVSLIIELGRIVDLGISNLPIVLSKIVEFTADSPAPLLGSGRS